MIRPTVARVDLGALKSNYRHIVDYLAADGAAGRRASSRSSRRTPTATARDRWRWRSKTRAPICWRAPTSRKARRCARPASARTSSSSARLSVSDLDGLFDCRLTPTISTPGAARAVQAAAEKYKQRVRYHLKIDTGMNRLGFRFDNLRRTLPELLASRNLELEAVYTHFATADDPESPLFDRAARALRQGARARLSDLQPRSRRRSQRRPDRSASSAVLPTSVRPRRQQRRAAARLARLVRPRAPRPAALRHRAAAARVDVAADADHDARQPHRRGEGRARGRRRRLRREVHRGAADDDRDRAGRLRGRPRPAARRSRRRADSRTPRADRRLGVHGHADGRRHRPRRRRRATRSSSSDRRATIASTCARWLHRSGRSRTRSCAGSAAGSSGSTREVSGNRVIW